MSSKRKNSRPTKIADIYEAPELFETFEGNELCGNYSTNDAYVQIQRFLDHDSEGEFAKPGYDDLIIPMNIEFDELSKDEEVNTTHEEASAKRTRKGKIKVNKTKKVKREKLKTTPKPLKYVCSICNYKSKRSDHHKRHLMIHLKNKPIKCFVCKYNTGRSDHYKRHLLRHGFSHQKVSAKDSGDKKKKLITIKVKKEIIEKHERGVRVVDLAQQYDRTTSTICTILKKKDEIKCVTPAKGVSRLSKQRTNIHEEMEKLLLIWINEKQLAGITLSETNIAEKARVLYGDLQKQYPGTSKQETSAEEFKASRGWFENFKKRTGVHSVVRHGEATSSNIKAAEEVLSPPLLAGEGYVSQQMFNCDETGLFWKKMPRRTYITAEEENTFCANASGEHKEELTTEELQLLQELQYTDAVEDIEGSAKKESVSEVVPTSVIKEVLAMWQTVQDFVEKYHPQKLSACRAAALFNDNGVDYFRGILKSRTKQISLDRFLNKRPASAESETSEAKSAKVPKSANNTCKERTPEIILPDVLMEGDFPYKH